MIVFVLIFQQFSFYVQKYKDSNSSAELNSLKYTQKLIDLRLSYLQSNKSGMPNVC